MATKPLPTVEEHLAAIRVLCGKPNCEHCAEMQRQRDAAIRADELERCVAELSPLSCGCAARIRALPPLPPEGEGE